jgi:hypothetical protein
LKKVLHRVWTWSWLVTLPVTLVFLSWATQTVGRYWQFGVVYNAAPLRYTLLDVGEETLHSLLRKVEFSFFPEGLRGEGRQADLPVIALFVPERNLAELNSNLPHSGFKYVKGGLWNGQDVQDVKFRYRGDYGYHWAHAKKSLRVKTRKEELFAGLRTFNLLAPKFSEQLNNYFGYRLAHEMDLIAPRTELVEVVLNGKRIGVHVLCEQLEELTLRRSGFMPGDIYSGELIARDAYRGIKNELFMHPGLWEKAAVNNHYAEDSRAPLERLIELCNAYPSDEAVAELGELVDLETWGRFSAFETLAQTDHYDRVHNWRLYYDANRGHFVPIIWDPIGWGPCYRNTSDGLAQLDVVNTRLHTLLFMNARFLHARQRAFADFFGRGAGDTFLEEIDAMIPRLRNALAVDPNVRPLDTDEIEEAWKVFRGQVEKTFREASRAHVEDVGSVGMRSLAHGEGHKYGIGLQGRLPLERLVFEFDVPVGEVDARLRFRRDGEVVEHEVLGSTELGGTRLTLELGLMVPVYRNLGARYENTNELEGGYYELLLGGVPASTQLVTVLADRGTAELQAVRSLQTDEEPLRNLYCVLGPRPSTGTDVWTGTIHIDSVREVNEEVVIQPGTTVLLGPGAGLIFRKRVRAQATDEQPIRFLPAVEGAPWGAVALQGPGTNGSRFRSCHFSNGSGVKADLYEYSAMFSIHDAQDVRVRACPFSDSRVVDDMVHAVYSEVMFSRCKFERALFDALDLDICRATLSDCTFLDGGNDAIDLMSTEAVVARTRMLRSGDKGISVGEGSTLLVLDSRFEECEVGVQVKDSSLAVVHNADFVANKLALDAYKKNWRYAGGGRAVVQRSRFLRNEDQVTADRHSMIRLGDSFFDRIVEAVPERILVDANVDTVEREKASAAPSAELPPEVAQLHDLGVRLWQPDRLNMRGSNLAVP